MLEFAGFLVLILIAYYLTLRKVTLWLPPQTVQVIIAYRCSVNGVEVECWNIDGLL